MIAKFLAGAVAVVSVLAAVDAAIHFSTLETVTNVKILDKERIVDSKTSKYLIFAESETFENVDSFWAFKYNSSDIYGRISRGDICTVTVTGFRVPFFSMYRNILSAKCELEVV